MQRLSSASFEIVKISQLVCTCGMWDLHGIPCNHAARVYAKFPVLQRLLYPSSVTVQYWREQYVVAGEFNLPSENTLFQLYAKWSTAEATKEKISTLFAFPFVRRLRGRPPNTARKLSFLERNKASRKRGRSSHCSTCSAEGHNKRSCPLSRESKEK